MLPILTLLALLGPQEAEPSYARDIAPIFEAHCVECHGPKKHKSGLRLDTAARALAGSDNGEFAVIEPGDSAESLLYELLVSDDEDERMPPKGEPLTSVQLDTVKRWIDAGAHGPAEGDEPAEEVHWAYASPVRPEPPAIGEGWARGDLDRFVLKRISEAGLAPSPEADRATLLRRLSLDITGLPPSLEELDAFVADDRDDAYERAVDRLLASEAYGERMARGWLDLARYADTNGYEKDSARSMWRWRDWVIAAYNADLPFDQFTIEQLAGDLLPNATLEQRIATGFHRNTMINAEGGVDPEEYRVAAVVDRVNTTGSVWMGSTLDCARCHTHKFDPFSQREYYRVFAFFNSTADVGPSDAPRLAAPTAEQAEAEQLAAEEQARLEERLSTWTEEDEERLSEYRRTEGSSPAEFGSLQEELEASGEDSTLATPDTFVIHPLGTKSEKGASFEIVKDDSSVLVSSELPETDTYVFEAQLGEQQLLSLSIDVLTDDSLPGGGPGRTPHGNFVLSEVTAEVDVLGEVTPIALENARADHFQVGTPRWPAEDAIDGDPKTGWAIGGGERYPHRIEFEFSEPLTGPTGATLRLKLDQLYGGKHLIGRLRVQVSTLPRAASNIVAPPDIRAWLEGENLPATETGLERLHTWFLSHTPTLDDERARLAELRARPMPPTTLVMQELDEPRTTHVLARGSFLSPGEEVQAGVPAVMGSYPSDAPANRLGFARWLVNGEHPLTARVMVNRLWAQVFGRGLVTTLGDFGTQGAAPSHPELLDWLACEFVEQGWSTKQLLRTLVTSATYRQASLVTPESYEADPQNILLARGARYRIEAEMVRDLALCAAGLLDTTLGGPSVFPPQPEGIWNMTYSGARWQAATDGDRFRRGLYTFWRRTAPYPTFMAFDAPSRELACTRRDSSNTPLQALALLNDPAFVEAAVALAVRMMRETEGDLTQRAAHGFRLCTGREPDAQEVEVLVALFEAELARFEVDAEAAAALTTLPFEIDTLDLSPPELAAWSLVANVLLNLDETVTRS